MGINIIQYVSITCITLITLLVFVIRADVTFGPEDPENNGIIFEGENVVLICHVTDVAINEVTQFNVSYESSYIILNNIDVSNGNISQFQSSNNKIRFVLPSVGMVDSGSYKCEVLSNNRNSEMKTHHLIVSSQNTVECKHNSTYKTLSIDTLKLSCYFTSSHDFVWMQIASNGESFVLESNLTQVNNVKSHLISYVQPSDTLTKSTYSCQLSTISDSSSLQPSEGCNIGSFIVYSLPLVKFSPDVKTISPGDNITISCLIVDTSSTSSITIRPLWSTPKVMDGITSEIRELTILEIYVSDSVIDGSNITATCEVFIADEQSLSYPLLITVISHIVVTSTLPISSNTDISTLPTSNMVTSTIPLNNTATSTLPTSNTITSTIPLSNTAASTLETSNMVTSALPMGNVFTITPATSSTNPGNPLEISIRLIAIVLSSSAAMAIAVILAGIACCCICRDKQENKPSQRGKGTRREDIHMNDNQKPTRYDTNKLHPIQHPMQQSLVREEGTYGIDTSEV